MFDKDINNITEDDLKALIDNEVPEDRTLEYKGTLDLNNPDSKRKLLKTVSAFANTSGGLLIYGINENDGIPDKLDGLKIDNIDEEIRGISDVIRTRSEPIITSIEINHVSLTDSDRIVLLIKIPKSWRAPHRVRMNGSKEFYIRINNKSEPMDVEDLRISFNLSETATERIRKFREKRIADIISGETPLFLNTGAKLSVHLIPFNSFNPNQSYDLTQMEYKHEILDNISPIHGRYLGYGYNFDGFIKYETPKTESNSYVQLFRNGIIESTIGSYSDEKNIYQVFDQKAIVHSITKYVEALKNLGVETPILIFISLINVKGYSMPNRRYNDRIGSEIINRDILLLPEIIIENYDAHIGNILKPCSDTVFNACGLEKSPYYDENREWNPK